MDPNNEYKVVVVGTEGVGKTTLCVCAKNGFVAATPPSTIGIDFVKLQRKSGLVLSIWDTAGQERYSSLLRTYLSRAAVALIVFDLTRNSTFEDAKSKWLDLIIQQNGDDCEIIFVGTKSDLVDFRSVEYNEATEFAMVNGYQFFETTSKLPITIAKVFDAAEFSCDMTSLERRPDVIQVRTPSQTKMRSCCRG